MVAQRFSLPVFERGFMAAVQAAVDRIGRGRAGSK
jgi:hypothetical protein